MMAKTTKQKKSFADMFNEGSEFNVELFDKTSTLLSDPKGYVSTGNFALDAALGTPGIPLGKIIEVNGKPHSGKTTLTYQIAREAQKMGGYAAVYDIETSMNTGYLARLGVEDQGNLFRLSPQKGELWTVESVFKDISETTARFAKDFPDAPGIFIVDSLGAMKDRDSAEKGIETEKAKPGAVAKAMANVMRVLPPVISGTMISVIIINHSYQAIGPMTYTKNFGGDALGYAKQLGLFLKTTTALDTKNKELGYNVELKIQKNKTAATSYRTVNLALVKNAGFDNYFTAFQVLSAAGVINTTSNGRTTLTDEVKGEIKFTKKFQGLKEACQEDPELNERVMAKYKDSLASMAGE